MRIEHGHESRVIYQQHGPRDFCINRTLIKKRLLVKFSCEFPTRYPPLRDLLLVTLLVFVTSGCHNSRTRPPQRTLRSADSFTLLFYSSSTEGWHSLSVKKKLQPGPRLKEYTSQAGEAQPVKCISVHVCISVVLPCVDMVNRYFRVEGLCCGIPL